MAKDKADYIIPLSSSMCQSSRLVGYKASRLAEMHAQRFPIPKGIVVSNTAFKAFCSHNGFNLETASEDMSIRIRNGDLPPILKKEIQNSLNHIPGNCLAVRSSSFSEDGQEFSMAGQLKTYLYVPREDVVKKVKYCWASLFGKTSAAYRRKGVLISDFTMGVIIQEQVDAIYSGVLFSLDPVRKIADYFVVEWVKGSGEKLVAGRVNPDFIYIQRDGPFIPFDFPPSLSEAINEAFSLGKTAEKLFKCPIDMEWVYGRTGVKVLQVRPITALFNDGVVVWTNVNMVENFPKPLIPLAWSVVDLFYRAYMRSLLRVFGWKDKDLKNREPVVRNLTGIQCGRIYYNLNSWYEILNLFPCSRWLIRFFDHYIGQKVPVKFKLPNANQERYKNLNTLVNACLFWFRLIRVGCIARWTMDQFEKKFYRQRAYWRHRAYECLSTHALCNALREMLTFVDNHWTAPGMADLLVMIFPGLLDVMTSKWITADSDSVIMRLLQGLDVNSIKSSRQVWEITQKIKTNQRLVGYLRCGDYQHLEAALDDELQLLLNTFMDQFGGRCYYDCMLVSPTFQEQHDLFWDLVKGCLDTSETDPLLKHSSNVTDRERFAHSLLAQLPSLKRCLYRWVLKLAQKAIALRERGRLFQSLFFGEIRLVVQELGKKLIHNGYLTNTQDIFYLRLDEIERLSDGKYQFPETIIKLIEIRKKAFAENSAKELPEFFYLGQGEYFNPEVPIVTFADDSRVLKGRGVSKGEVKGTARIILDPTKGNNLNPGDILITKTMDPGWTPLFLIAGGLILERGGFLSHGAIVAREFGIPAVAGIVNATTKIQDGQCIMLDGNAGLVNIISD